LRKLADFTTKTATTKRSLSGSGKKFIVLEFGLLGGFGESPKLERTHLAVPPKEPFPAWWCYIGPIPEFEE